MVEEIKIAEGYKQTEVGVIPEDWEVVELPEVGESIIGLTYSPSHISPYGKLVLRSSNVQNGRLSFKDNVFVEMDFPERVIVKEGDILICVRNGSKRLIGKCALIDKKTEGSAFGAFMSVFRSKKSRYVFFQFQSHIIQRQINQSLGATINQITNKDLASFKIPLPPTLTEQTAIATALSDMDALIEKLEQLIAKKRNIKHGAMQELLKPKEGWEVRKLGEIADFENGKAHEQFIDEQGDFIVINSKFISTEGRVKKYSNKNIFPLKRGDITIVMSDIPKGKALAKCFLIDQENKYTLNQRIGGITANEDTDNKYLFYKLNRNKYYLAFDSGTGQTNIKRQEILDCPVVFPPTKAEQTAIATALSDMDSEIEKSETQLSKYKMIKTGMMQELLTGKKRLI